MNSPGSDLVLRDSIAAFAVGTARRNLQDDSKASPPSLRSTTRVRWHGVFLWLALLSCAQAQDSSNVPLLSPLAKREPANARRWPGVTYWQDRIQDEPWSLHVIKIDRAQKDLRLLTGLARNTVFGLAPLTSMIRSAPKDLGRPIAGINGDFYEVDGGPFIGDPRGIQILNGELVSGPGDQQAFWIDAAGEPHTGIVLSRFSLLWPDGTKSSLKLNEQRGMKEVVLYTPRLGSSTRAPGGREVILENDGQEPWLPLAAGKVYKAKIISINDNGNTPLQPGKLVLSSDQKVTGSNPVECTMIIKELEKLPLPKNPSDPQLLRILSR